MAVGEGVNGSAALLIFLLGSFGRKSARVRFLNSRTRAIRRDWIRANPIGIGQDYYPIRYVGTVQPDASRQALDAWPGTGRQSGR